MSPDRTLLVAVFVALVTVVACALLLLDGFTWPGALLGGLGAGGCALWGLPSWFARTDEAAGRKK